MSENNKVPERKVIVDWKQLNEEAENAGTHRIEDVRRSFEAQIMDVGGERVKYEQKLKKDLDSLCHANDVRGMTNIQTGETSYEYTEQKMRKYNMLVGGGVNAKSAYDTIMNQAKAKFR